jgi:hypothetical protein
MTAADTYHVDQQDRFHAITFAELPTTVCTLVTLEYRLPKSAYVIKVYLSLGQGVLAVQACYSLECGRTD